MVTKSSYKMLLLKFLVFLLGLERLVSHMGVIGLKSVWLMYLCSAQVQTQTYFLTSRLLETFGHIKGKFCHLRGQNHGDIYGNEIVLME